MANKTLWLMNVGSPHFTMRHLIMGLGRVQESCRVKILDPRKEKVHILPVAKLAFDTYNSMAQESKKQETEAKKILEAAENAVNADLGFDAGDFNDADSECSDYVVEGNFFSDAFD